MSEPSPELRWAPIEPKPRNWGRIRLIVGLAIAGLAVLAILLILLLPRGESPTPGVSGSPSPAATASPDPSSTTTPSSSPTRTPEITPPAPTDPSLENFRAQVGGWLGAADRGLDIVSSSDAQDAVSVIDSLQMDAQRLSDARPPASIDQMWRDGVTAYGQTLSDLRTAASAGNETKAAVAAARASAHELQSLLGL